MTRKPSPKSSAPTSPLFEQFKSLLAPRPVVIDGITASLFVKPLTGGEMGEITKSATRPGRAPGDVDALDAERFGRAMIAACVCDGDGNQVFNTEAEIAGLPNFVLLNLQREVLKVNGMADGGATDAAA